MNQLFFTFFLIAFCFPLNAQPIDWDAVLDRFEEKYQPEINPEWLFPIIFKNGDGARDTIYIGHHPDSHIFGGFQPDAVFGEKWLPADTSVFQVHLLGECMGDSICELVKSDISPDYEIPHTISFIHGKLPVRMYFTSAYFRSGTLPQYNPPELPQLQGEVWEHSIGVRLGSWNDELQVWDEFCPFDAPVLLSDTARFDEYCAYPDSVYIGDIPDQYEFTNLYNIDLNFSPWEGTWVAVKTPQIRILKLFPNPCQETLFLSSSESLKGSIRIFNAFGKQIQQFQASGNSHKINTQNLSPGIYFLEWIKDGKEAQVLKFIKQ